MKELKKLTIIKGGKLTRTEKNNKYICEVNQNVYNITPHTKEYFYNSCDWKELRQMVFVAYKNICFNCGCKDHTLLHVDHIVPVSVDPERCLDFRNMQILCESCNLSKGNKNTTRYKTYKRFMEGYCYNNYFNTIKKITKNWSIYFKKIRNVDRIEIFEMVKLKSAGVSNDQIIEFDQLIYANKNPSLPMIDKPFKAKTIRRLAS